MALRAGQFLLDGATLTLRHAVEVAYASGLLGPVPRTSEKVRNTNAFAPLSGTDSAGLGMAVSMNCRDDEEEKTRDRIRFASRCVETSSVAASSMASSVTHMEGVVQRVECGYKNADMVLQLIVEVKEGDERLPLAVRWRPGCNESLQRLKTGAYVDSAKQRLEGRRVLLSGRLQMEECYDTHGKVLYKVPILILPPTPSFEGSSLSILTD